MQNDDITRIISSDSTTIIQEPHLVIECELQMTLADLVVTLCPFHGIWSEHTGRGGHFATIDAYLL